MTNHNWRCSVWLSEAEYAEVKHRAKKIGDSTSNLIREALGFPKNVPLANRRGADCPAFKHGRNVRKTS